MQAIILAAGMGTRLRPLTNRVPKALIPVAGEPMIMRQIRFLREVGIDDITVVTGYLAECFSFLEGKHGINLIHNPKYNVWNNLYSLYLVKDLLGDNYILEGDVYLTRNFLTTELRSSTYFTGIKSNFEKEWIVKTNGQGRVTNITIADGTDNIMSGVSYWSSRDGVKLRSLLDHAVSKAKFETMFWDDLVKDNLEEFSVYVREIAPSDWFEIDRVSDLDAAERYVMYYGAGS